MKFQQVKDNKLYTPIIQYKKGDLIINSIGTTHIAQSEYYDRLQKEIDAIEVGFFEGIKPLTSEDSIPPEKKKYIAGLQRVSEAYRTFAKYLGMEYQKDRLNYGESWQNPDLTLDEFIIAASDEVLKKLVSLGDDSNSIEILFESGLARGLKGVTLQIFFSIDDEFSKAYGHEKTVSDQRNQRLFDDLQLKFYDEVDRLGITYGVRHLKGIDEFLRNNGFKREGQLWIPAMELDGDLS